MNISVSSLQHVIGTGIFTIVCIFSVFLPPAFSSGAPRNKYNSQLECPIAYQKFSERDGSEGRGKGANLIAFFLFLQFVIHIPGSPAKVGCQQSWRLLYFNTAVPLHAMEALGGRGGIAPTHSRPRH
jgi:hypothetical protein